MLALLRRSSIRRLLVALVLAAFLPVAGATVACQVLCAGEALGTTEAGTVSHHHAEDAAPAPDPARYLSHGGPCHLTVVPTLVQAPLPTGTEAPQPGWDRTGRIAYVSFVPPPPEHRPRG